MKPNLTNENPDDVIGSIQNWRQQTLDRFGGDVDAVFADAQARTKASGHRVLKPGDLANGSTLQSRDELTNEATFAKRAPE